MTDDEPWVGDEVRLTGLRRHRRSLLLTPWRWRYEVGGVAGLFAIAYWVDPLAAPVPALLIAASCLWRPARNRLRRRMWCVVTQHRLRAAMVECGLYSRRRGRLPAILWTSPRPRGVRLVLWCPAGVDAPAFSRMRRRLAAACWAADVVAVAHPTRTQVVHVFVALWPEDLR